MTSRAVSWGLNGGNGGGGGLGGATGARNQSGGSGDEPQIVIPGNLLDEVALPPGCDSRSLKKGHLIFNSNFESGNLAQAEMVNDFEYDLSIRPDTCNPKYRVWFYFTVRNVRKGQRVVFNIINYSKTKSLFRHGMSPLVSSTSRPHWERIPSKNVFYYRSARHKKSYVLSFLFAFDREEDVFCFSYSFPYSYTHLQRYLDILEAQKYPFFRREVLGRTVQQRNLDLLTITAPENMELPREATTPNGRPASTAKPATTSSPTRAGGAGLAPGSRGSSRRSSRRAAAAAAAEAAAEDGAAAAAAAAPPEVVPPIPKPRKQKVVFITARVHPGESPASFVCQGVIDFLVSEHPDAKLLRKHTVFKIIPMLNPDGVYLGNYRCSFLGYDLNRHWQVPSMWAHPTLVCVKNLLLDLNRDPLVDLEFFLDIHAHSTLMNGFIYGNTFEDVERLRQQAIFPQLLGKNAKDFSMANTSFNQDKVKEGTGRRTFGEFLDARCNCYTLEVSFFSYQHNTLDGVAKVSPYAEQDYMKLGKNVAKTFCDFFRLHDLKESPF